MARHHKGSAKGHRQATRDVAGHHAPPTPRRQSALLWGIIGIVLISGALIGMAAFADQGRGVDPEDAPGTAEGIQVVRIAVEGYEYVPATVEVEVGRPVTFIMDATDAAGCARYFVFKEFGISALLKQGENTFTFTPTRIGTFEFSCSMRMVIGNMVVR